MTKHIANSFVIVLEHGDEIASMRYQVRDKDNAPTIPKPGDTDMLRKHAEAYAKTLGWAGLCKISIVGPLTVEKSTELYDAIPGDRHDPALIDALVRNVTAVGGGVAVNLRRMPNMVS